MQFYVLHFLPVTAMGQHERLIEITTRVTTLLGKSFFMTFPWLSGTNRNEYP